MKLSLTPPPFLRVKKPRGRKAAGVKYERKGDEYFLRRFGVNYLPHPWVQFQVKGEPRCRWCQPDGLLIDPKLGRITIIEFKYSHTSDAWWQTMRLYRPVLRKFFPSALWEIAVCEVTKWYDPAVAFPVETRLVSDPSHVRYGQFGVMIWKPR